MVSFAEQLSNACKAFAQAAIIAKFESSNANLHKNKIICKWIATTFWMNANVCLLSLTSVMKQALTLVPLHTSRPLANPHLYQFLTVAPLSLSTTLLLSTTTLPPVATNPAIQSNPLLWILKTSKCLFMTWEKKWHLPHCEWGWLHLPKYSTLASMIP